MSNGIELSGLDDFIGFVDNMEITQEDEVKAIKKAMVSLQRYVAPKAPKGSKSTGKTEKSVKVKVIKKSYSTEGVVYVDSWYAVFQNYRNIKQKGNYIGWFDRAIADKESEALDIIAKELLR